MSLTELQRIDPTISRIREVVGAILGHVLSRLVARKTFIYTLTVYTFMHLLGLGLYIMQREQCVYNAWHWCCK